MAPQSTPTPAPKQLEILEGYCRFAPTGSVTLERGTQLVLEAIDYCRNHQHRRLVIDSRELVLPKVSDVDRYYFIDQWARAAAGAVKMAIVTRAEAVDPQHFGRTVGANRGLTITAFAVEADALHWLLDPKSD